MKITPLEIQNKQFPTRFFRGFDPDEVLAFLETVREDFEELLKENSSLKEQLKRADDQLAEYKKMDATMRETLITVQKMVEEYETNAKRQAENIIRDAELRADKIIREAQDKLIKIHEDITDLKGIRKHFKEEIRRLIENHMRMLEFDKERDQEGAGEI
ncbi:MAG: DivIVA domain-containing protein [Thermodesulfovibrionales bacterium]|nr:DivIVA domain-containing protein [Thermodesulfovibrionales bacterium]